MNKEEQVQLEVQTMLNSLASQRNQALDALAQREVQFAVMSARIKELEEQIANAPVVLEND